MTKQEKELLIKVLCEMLPYGTKVNISASKEYDNYIPSINDATIIALNLYNERCNFKEFYWDKEIINVRPYLRPMNSMTEEEILHIQNLVQNKNHELYSRIEECGATGTPDWKLYEISYIRTDEEIDYLNSRYLDWRGLIKKELALKAPEGMYNI